MNTAFLMLLAQLDKAFSSRERFFIQPWVAAASTFQPLNYKIVGVSVLRQEEGF
jgi:hypothetical protein